MRTTFGATPAATVNAQISGSLKKLGDASPFLRVATGTYTLSKPSSQGTYDFINGSLEDADSDEEVVEEQYEIVTSFGMFWDRDRVQWERTPKLLGMQQIGAIPVDFSNQLGIYLLYDGREVIYVGRSTDRPLGRRLYEHTVDRLSTRWNRFSWFGLLPVSNEGNLGSLPSTFDSSKLIPALEAVLIESLEPRQNRKRGDDLATVEYIQEEDEVIAKKRLIATLEQEINKN